MPLSATRKQNRYGIRLRNPYLLIAVRDVFSYVLQLIYLFFSLGWYVVIVYRKRSSACWMPFCVDCLCFKESAQDIFGAPTIRYNARLGTYSSQLTHKEVGQLSAVRNNIYIYPTGLCRNNQQGVPCTGPP